MILHRFMSREEYAAYLNGDVLHNDTDHFRGGRGGSTSVGFCFFHGNPDVWAHRLNGIVSFDVLLSMEYDQSVIVLSPTSGVYAVSPGNFFAGRMLLREYCTKTYSRKTLPKIRADFSFRNNPNFISLKDNPFYQ